VKAKCTLGVLLLLSFAVCRFSGVLLIEEDLGVDFGLNSIG